MGVKWLPLDSALPVYSSAVTLKFLI